MKRNIFKIAVILLISLGNIFISCGDKEKYPIEISVQYYSLYGTMCNWVNLENDGKVKIINSDEEMRGYVTCYMEENNHAVDFSKRSVLLIGSTASAGIYAIKEKKIQQISPNEYILNVVINLNEISEPLEWNIAIQTIDFKLPKDAHVELKVEELPATSIIGKWKLMKRQIVFGEASETDYSQSNIIYEFKTNNVVTISGDSNDIYPAGDYSYLIGNYGKLEFNKFNYNYFISSTELTIDGRMLDGPAYYLTKIK